MKITKKSFLFLVLFIVLGFIAIQIPLVNIVGSSRSFTVLELFGPSAGMLAGPIVGAVAVLVVKIIEAVRLGTQLDIAHILLFFTMPLAALYFGSKSKLVAIIPLTCIVLFVIHPIGRTVWFFSLYWLIPVVALFWKKHLILNSLGSTFTAHAVGGAIFLYAFELPAPVWLGLIPQVALERGFFAVGIWVSYLVLNNVLNLVVKRFKLEYLKVLVNENYLLSPKFWKKGI